MLSLLVLAILRVTCDARHICSFFLRLLPHLTFSCGSPSLLACDPVPKVASLCFTVVPALPGVGDHLSVLLIAITPSVSTRAARLHDSTFLPDAMCRPPPISACESVPCDATRSLASTTNGLLLTGRDGEEFVASYLRTGAVWRVKRPFSSVLENTINSLRCARRGGQNSTGSFLPARAVRRWELPFMFLPVFVISNLQSSKHGGKPPTVTCLRARAVGRGQLAYLLVPYFCINSILPNSRGGETPRRHFPVCVRRTTQLPYLFFSLFSFSAYVYLPRR